MHSNHQPLLSYTVRLILSAILLVAMISLLSGPPARAAEVPSRRAYNLPAGKATESLKLFSQQSGRGIIANGELIKGVTTNPVKGELTSTEALEMLLAETGLVAVQDEKTGAYSVRRETDAESKNVQRAVAPRVDDRPVRNDGSEILKLPDFSVSASMASRFAPRDAVSSSRIRAALIDTAASVSVAPAILFEETGAKRLYDVLQYLPGVSDANSPNISDRVTLRGFAANSGHFVDSVPHVSDANYDAVLIDRVEVVSGPNSILAANGLAGGTINIITKSPELKRSASLTATAARYFGDRIDLDLTGPVSNRFPLAYRLITSHQDANKYISGSDQQQSIVHVGLGYSKNGTNVTYKGTYYHWRSTHEGSVPVDPSAGTLVHAVPLQVVPFLAYLSPQLHRGETSLSHNLLVTSELGDKAVGRLFVQYKERQNGNGVMSPSATNGGQTDPRTGIFLPGVAFGPGPNFAQLPTAPAQQNWSTVRMSGSVLGSRHYNTVLQNDYVLKLYLPKGITSTTTLGGQVIWDNDRDLRDAYAPVTINFFAPVYPNPLTQTPNLKTISHARSTSGYLLQHFSVWDSRLSVHAGIQATANRRKQEDLLSNSVASETGNTTTRLGGVLFKFTPAFAAYGSYSESGAPISTGIALTPRVNQFGKQTEVGIKYETADGRLRFTAAYYDITFTNFRVSNPAAIANPGLPTSIFLDVKSYGQEYAITGQVTKEIDVIGNYSYNHLRDPLGRRQRGTADNQAGLMVSYTRRDGLLKGLNINCGISYTGSRAGDTQTGLTALGVPVQPTFYLPPRTLVNAGLGFPIGRMKFRVNVDNVFDEHYIYGTSRTVTYAGMPLNVTARLEVDF